jgi:hypothetical protein
MKQAIKSASACLVCAAIFSAASTATAQSVADIPFFFNLIRRLFQFSRTLLSTIAQLVFHDRMRNH